MSMILIVFGNEPQKEKNNNQLLFEVDKQDIQALLFEFNLRIVQPFVCSQLEFIQIFWHIIISPKNKSLVWGLFGRRGNVADRLGFQLRETRNRAVTSHLVAARCALAPQRHLAAATGTIRAKIIRLPHLRWRCESSN